MKLLFLSLTCVLFFACGTPEPVTDPDQPLNRPEEIDEGLNRILSDAQDVEIFSLNPMRSQMEDPAVAALPHFHDYAILDSKRVDGRERARELLNLVYRGIHESDGTVAACFNPRHGIRVHSKDEHVDFVICYECLSMHIHRGEQQDSALTTEGPLAEINGFWVAEGLVLSGK